MLRFIVLCMLVALALAGNWNVFEGKAKATPIVQQAVKSMPILQEQTVQSKTLPILEEQAVVQGKTQPILQEQAVQSKAFKSMPILQEQAVQSKTFKSLPVLQEQAVQNKPFTSPSFQQQGRSPDDFHEDWDEAFQDYVVAGYRGGRRPRRTPYRGCRGGFVCTGGYRNGVCIGRRRC